MARFTGRVVLVTGAARGQGRSHAVRFAREGASLVLLDAVRPVDSVAYRMPKPEDLDETARLVEQEGAACLAHVADVRERAEVDAVVAAAAERFGPPSVVVANAGICPPGAPFWEISEAEWDEVVDTNLKGVWNTVASAVPLMIEAGGPASIVVISSSAGLTHTTNMADYNASKAGAIALAKTMANELAPRGIRVNAVCPAAVGTDMILHDATYRLFRPDLTEPRLEDVLPVFRDLHPMGVPWLEPDDVSDAVLWLASDEARYVTGIALPVDLGWNNKAM